MAEGSDNLDWAPKNRFRALNITIGVLVLASLASGGAVHLQAQRTALERAEADCPGAQVEYRARGRAVIDVDGDPTAPYFSFDVTGCTQRTEVRIVCASWVPFLCGAVPEDQRWTDWTYWQDAGHR